MNAWTELVRRNPVIKESQLSVWERMNPRQWQTNTLLSVLIVGVVYIVLISLGLQAVRDIDPSLFMYVSLTTVIFASAIVLYGTVAGEREKRTLDLLLVAPVTTSQIIAAKLFRVVLPIVAILLLLGVPSLVFGIARIVLGETAFASGAPFAMGLVGSLALTFCVAVFVSGLSIFVSSINRTTAGALTGSLALIFLVYVVYAVMAGVIGSMSQPLSNAMMALHPYFVLAQLTSKSPEWQNPLLLTILCSALHAGAGVGLIVLAAKNLERERKKGRSPNA